MAAVLRQGIVVPGPGMPPQGTPTLVAPASASPEPLDQVDTTSTLSPAIALTGSPLMPNGGVPVIGVPNSQDYARLVFTAPYFGPNAIEDMVSSTPNASVQSVTSSSNVSVSAIATYVSMRQAAAASVIVTLPNNPPAGRSVTIKDSLGVCSTDNFTINTTDGTLIDGQPTYTFMVGFQSQLFVFDGIGWGING